MIKKSDKIENYKLFQKDSKNLKMNYIVKQTGKGELNI